MQWGLLLNRYALDCSLPLSLVALQYLIHLPFGDCILPKTKLALPPPKTNTEKNKFDKGLFTLYQKVQREKESLKQLYQAFINILNPDSSFFFGRVNRLLWAWFFSNPLFSRKNQWGHGSLSIKPFSCLLNYLLRMGASQGLQFECKQCFQKQHLERGPHGCSGEKCYCAPLATLANHDS